jgi:hypothetical protein
MFDKGNEHLIEEYQRQVDKNWKLLMNLNEMR